MQGIEFFDFQKDKWTNEEIMRIFFYDLPEALEQNGTPKKKINEMSDQEMLDFIQNLHMDYATQEQTEAYEHNKELWSLVYEMRLKGKTLVLSRPSPEQ